MANLAPASHDLPSRNLEAPPVRQLTVSAYRIPTEEPESDGTLVWQDTTLVLVEASAGGVTGIGYSYADSSTAYFIDAHLNKIVVGMNAMDVSKAWQAMVDAIRNLGRPGVASMAIAAVDIALWDLKAKLLNQSLAELIGATRNSVPVYGSGGFTSYSIPQLQKQLADWTHDGMRWVKMKVGRHPGDDVERVRAAREAIGETPGLFVDANGAYDREQARGLATLYKELDVRWLEEPVSSDDLEGLRIVRETSPGGMQIAAGEYGYHLFYFRRMIEAGAVDVLQADVTRCAGITEWLRVAALSQAFHIPLSAHGAPSLHVHLGCAISSVVHIEYFYDHVRIEDMLFEGIPQLIDGNLLPDLTAPGLGLIFKHSEAARYAIYGND